MQNFIEKKKSKSKVIEGGGESAPTSSQVL